jgi:hypothetical protein
LSVDLASMIVLGLGCAANHRGIMIAVLLLDARRGRGIVWAYVVAWVGAITVVMTALRGVRRDPRGRLPGALRQWHRWRS